MKYSVIFSLIVSVLVSQSASAQQQSKVVYEEDMPVTKQASCLSQSGKSSQSSLSGFSRNIPLETAVRQVVPSSFAISDNGFFSSSKPAKASWSANSEWTSELENLCSQHGFYAHVDWSAKKVLIVPPAPAKPKTVAAVTPAEAPKPAEQVKVISSAPVAKVEVASAPAPAVVAKADPAPVKKLEEPAKSVVAPVVVPATMPKAVVVKQPVEQKPYVDQMRQMWQLDPSLTLRENVEAWTKKAGWNKVVWLAVDYPVIAPASFEGHFASQTGPLAQVISAYENSDQPLVARLSVKDKVVEIRNKNFLQTNVTSVTPDAMNQQENK